MCCGLHPYAFHRAAILCVLFAFGLWPQTTDARRDDPVVSVELDTIIAKEYGNTHSRFEEALGHCHLGLDCAVTAMTVEPTQAPQTPVFDGDGFRFVRTRLNGLGPLDEPPLPRGVRLQEYGITKT